MTRLQRQGRSAPHSDTCSRISARISRGICCTRSCARRVPAVRFPTLRPARVSASPATDPATAETSRWSAHCCTDSARRTGRAAGVCHRAGRGGPVGGTWHCGARLKRRQRLPWKSDRCHATTVAWCARCSLCRSGELPLCRSCGCMRSSAIAAIARATCLPCPRVARRNLRPSNSGGAHSAGPHNGASGRIRRWETRVYPNHQLVLCSKFRVLWCGANA
jgi:hypothetical protein